MHFKTAIAAGVCLAGSTLAIDLDISDASSINAAAKTVAASIIDRYQNNGSGIPGLFGDPYYFWECGLAWDSLIHYWHQTGDDSYNGIVGEAIRWQLGDDNNFMPSNQTKSLGNDDQSTWAFAAMSAAEYGFPSEALDGLDISWSDLAKNVFDSQAARWDNETCNGGLRWQIFPFNNGYNYKNSMTNGNFYQLAGRLARFTGNETYAEWGQRVFEWSFHNGLIADINSTAPGSVYDGTSVNDGCGEINHIQWTANAGTYLAGGAYMYNHTPTAINSNHQTFVPRINDTFANAKYGYGNGTLVEIACQPRHNCNVDQLAFRAVLARALAQTRALTDDTRVRRYTEPVNFTSPRNVSQADSVPAWSTHERIDFMLQQSAIGAASQCSGGPDGTTCGSDWGYSMWDGSSGLGQDLSALNIFLANIPIGNLATVNVTAGGAGGSRGTLEDANDTITDAGDLIDAAGDAASDAASASGAARQVTMSSIALLAIVGSVMASL